VSTQFDEGRYKVRIIDQYATESSMKGTRGFVLMFQVLANITQPDKPITCRFPRKVTLWVTDKTFRRVLQTLQSLGYAGTTLGGVDPGHENYHSFRDVETEVDCKHETDQYEQVQERWDLVRVEPKLTDGSAFEEFDEILRSEQTAKGRQTVKDKRRAEDAEKDAVAVPDGITDDDVPF
jgi:hypothetical protein